MAYSGRNYSTASPVLGMQPRAIHQSPFDKPLFPYQVQSFRNPASCAGRPSLLSTATFAGRKRSRDEAAANLDEPDKVIPAPKVKEADEEWEYGPGMVLIKKTGYVIDASTQSGTWVEEKASKEHNRKLEEALVAQEKISQERPSLRSHKSQRLTLKEEKTTPAQNALHSGSPQRDTTPEGPSQPVVDEFTIHLGIGWAQLSADEGIQAAARGWQRYIENHFPVTNTKIRLQSKGLNAYLVEASEGLFLFADDLREGRLVSRNAYCALQNLKSSPPIFDGETIIAAASAAPASTAVMDVDMN